MKAIRTAIAAVFIGIITVMSMSAVAWQPQHITAVGVGPSSNLTITANITVAEIDTWKMGNFYVVVVWEGKVLALSQNNGWVAYDAKKPIPAAVENVHLWNQVVQVVSAPVDLSTLAGAYVYAGYGVGQNDAEAENDMFVGGKSALVYGICPPTQFWGDTSCVTPDTTRVWLPAIGEYAYPSDVEVTSPNKLTAGCTDWQCFKNTVKWILSPAVAIGAQPAGATVTCPMVGAYFTNALGHDQLLLFCSDTGTVWGGGNWRFYLDVSSSSLKLISVRGSIKGWFTAIEDGSRLEMRWFLPTTQAGVSSNIWQWVLL